jgi:hypothetical protein
MPKDAVILAFATIGPCGRSRARQNANWQLSDGKKEVNGRHLRRPPLILHLRVGGILHHVVVVDTELVLAAATFTLTYVGLNGLRSE